MYYYWILKDPDSFKVYSEKYKLVGDNDVEWTLDWGAKNGYGAMTRKIETFKTTKDWWIIIDGEMYLKKDLK